MENIHDALFPDELAKPLLYRDDFTVSFPQHHDHAHKLKFSRLRASGMKNFGVSCFMNAVLQSLAATRPLAKFCLLTPFDTQQELCCGGKVQFCPFCELSSLITKLYSTQKAVNPKSFLKNIKKLSRDFETDSQEDAHEFLRCVLNKIQTMFLEKKNKERIVRGLKPLPLSFEETSLLFKIFGGKLKSTIICEHCRNKSTKLESFLDLSLEIDDSPYRNYDWKNRNGSKSTNLHQCFNRFFRLEYLNGENKYKCEKCNAYRNAKKYLKISDFPQILTISLKRFDHFVHSKKNNKFVLFPNTLAFEHATNRDNYFTTSTLEQSFKSERLRNSSHNNSLDSHFYSLYCVIEHIGGTEHGHFIAYVKRQDGWDRYDDEQVTKVSHESVMRRQAYILFYQKEKNPQSSNNCSTPKNVVRKTLISQELTVKRTVNKCEDNNDGRFVKTIPSVVSKPEKPERKELNKTPKVSPRVFNELRNGEREIKCTNETHKNVSKDLFDVLNNRSNIEPLLKRRLDSQRDFEEKYLYAISETKAKERVYTVSDSFKSTSSELSVHNENSSSSLGKISSNLFAFLSSERSFFEKYKRDLLRRALKRKKKARKRRIAFSESEEEQRTKKRLKQ